jgi:hypothetical protein
MRGSFSVDVRFANAVLLSATMLAAIFVATVFGCFQQ